jgi:hypothetical protein
MMTKPFIAFFIVTAAAPSFSQVEVLFNNFKGTSEINYEKIDSLHQIPEEVLTGLKTVAQAMHFSARL